MAGLILGDLPPTCGHGEQYWRERDCFVDARGRLEIDRGSFFGYQVMLLTQSHDVTATGTFVAGSPVVDRGVRVDAGAFVCSRAVLYNCHIGERAIVAVGAVVRSQRIPAHVIVAGNPAQIVARWDEITATWRWIKARYEVIL